MKRGWTRTLVVGLVTGMLSVLVGGIAAAATVWSDRRVFWVIGEKYIYDSVGTTGSGTTDYAYTGITHSPSGVVGTGWMGARPRVYFSNGSGCQFGTWTYNSQASQTHASSVTSNCSGFVYSQGLVEAWNGSGYERHESARTPNF